MSKKEKEVKQTPEKTFANPIVLPDGTIHQFPPGWRAMWQNEERAIVAKNFRKFKARKMSAESIDTLMEKEKYGYFFESELPVIEARVTHYSILNAGFNPMEIYAGSPSPKKKEVSPSFHFTFSGDGETSMKYTICAAEALQKYETVKRQTLSKEKTNAKSAAQSTFNECAKNRNLPEKTLSFM